MTVTVRPYDKGGKKGWEVDIMLTIPGRPKIRERKKAPVRTKSAARRWGEERERQLIQHYANLDPDDDAGAPDVAAKEVPTLAQFIPRYIEGHCMANRLRPATMEQRITIYDHHLIPALGRRRLDKITPEDIQRFKAARTHLKCSTVNLMLKLLKCILNIAVEWKVIGALPLKMQMLKEAPRKTRFYDFEELDRLVLESERFAPSRVLMVLLGSEAGLRRGEMIGLKWSDIDFGQETLSVSRSIWKGKVGPTKGGRSRTIPLAPRLKAALVRHRHLRGPWVLHTAYGPQARAGTVVKWLGKVQRAAGFESCGPHILRHTFCSHLAMRGAPVRVIQALAGHSSITTTERYMHLAPAATRDAVKLLSRPEGWRNSGEAPGGVINLNDFDDLDEK